MAETETQRPKIRKVTRRVYSYEEVEDRFSKGLCMLCDEQDSSEHQKLKHKKGIFMIELDKDQPLVDLKEAHEISLHSQHDEPVVETLALKVQDSISDVLQVPNEKEVRSLSQQTSKDDDRNCTHQVFDEMPVRKFQEDVDINNENQVSGKITTRVRSEEKFKRYFKTWKFKFKARTKRYKVEEDMFCLVDEMRNFVNVVPHGAVRLKKIAEEMLENKKIEVQNNENGVEVMKKHNDDDDVKPPSEENIIEGSMDCDPINDLRLDFPVAISEDTLKRKTFELLYKMTKSSNVEVIVDRMIDYMISINDNHYKTKIASRCVELAEQFAPSNQWFIQTMNKVFEHAGDLVNIKVAHNLMRLIAEGFGEDDDDADSKLRLSAVESYLQIISEPKLPSLFLQVISWVLGKYGTADGKYSASYISGKLCDVADSYSSDENVKGYAVSALMKIYTFEVASGRKVDVLPECQSLIEELLASHSTDLQHGHLEQGEPEAHMHVEKDDLQKLAYKANAIKIIVDILKTSCDLQPKRLHLDAEISGHDNWTVGSWNQSRAMSTFNLNVDINQNGNADTSSTVDDIDDIDFSKLLEKPRPLNIDRLRSLDERSLTELNGSPQLRNADNARVHDHTDYVISPNIGRRSGYNTPRTQYGFEFPPMVGEAWDALRASMVYFRGQPVGTIAAVDNSEEKLNYDQVFVRDFVPSALAFLMNGEPEIVKNFILKTLRLQSWEKKIDRFQLGEGVMPASFKVFHDPVKNHETLIADFGESAIGRVTPVDSCFWWVILLRAYTKSTGDSFLADMPECQKGIRLILSLCLSEGFDTFPTLLCADGCCMVDRRMGVYGYPIEIQALFFMALRCALLLLKQEGEGKEMVEQIVKRLHALSYHMRNYFWLDLKQLNVIYRYKTEEYSHTAVNKFSVIPDSLPEWIFDFMPHHGGVFLGNVSPARMDFRWFALGNCIAILSSLATPEQSIAIMDLIESRWEELVGEFSEYHGQSATYCVSSESTKRVKMVFTVLVLWKEEPPDNIIL